MAQAQVNGDVPSSAFLKGLLEHPIIHDGVDGFKANPYGQRSIQLSDSAYQRFAKPVIPYLQTPYSYVSPYVKKADEFGARTLSRVDERFPVVKKPTNELYADTKTIVLYPYTKAFESRDHVLDVYSSEFKKAAGGADNAPSIVAYGKAAVATALIVTAETVSWAAGFLSAKKEAVENKVNNSSNN